MQQEPTVWEYTLTPVESERWRDGDTEERRELLEEMGPWIVKEARRHGCTHFTIHDVDGQVIAQGTWGYHGSLDDRLRPYDPDEYPTQNRRN